MTAKKGGEGRAKFVNLVNDFRREQRPQVEKAWAKLPLWYRRRLYEHAAVPVSDVDAPLFSLTEGQRKRLLQANHVFAAVAAESAKILGSAVMSQP